MDKIKDKRIVFIISIFLILALLKSESLIPTNYQYYEEGFYSTNLDTTTVKNEYMPKWVVKKPDNLYQKKIVTTLGSKVSNVTISSQKILFSIYQKEKEVVSVNTIYFPGWILLIDGKPAKINYLNDQGIITFVVDKGDHDVELLFKETPIRLLSDLVSVFAFVSLLLYSGNKKLKILKHD